MSERIWILGAADPEMEAIEALLRVCGERIAYAVDDRGERVHPGNAYRAASIRHDGDDHWYSGNDSAAWGHYVDEHDEYIVPQAYVVECRMACDTAEGIPGPRGVVVIDHHRPGDPGYGRPPEEFMAASSIGQVVTELARLGGLPESWSLSRLGVSVPGAAPCQHGEFILRKWYTDARRWLVGDRGSWSAVPTDLVLTAAADHCLGAAYRGECLGIDPDELMRWRAESRAKFQKRDVEEVLADIERAQDRIMQADRIALASTVFVRDLRMTGSAALPDARGAAVPELPEAALRMGEGYIAGPLNTPDGRQKIVCSGTREQVEAFLKHWAPANQLTDTYGDPQRGFAGGYLP